MQAIIITAYKDLQQLKRLIESFHDEACIFIHLDAKSNLQKDDLKDLGYKRIYVEKKYKIEWGSLNHLLSILDLLKVVVERDDISYIHIVSGQDILVTSIKSFNAFFSENQHIYMTCTNMEDFSDAIRNRYQKGVLFPNVTSKNSIGKAINRMYGIKKPWKKTIGEFSNLYKGMIWASMPIEVCKYVLSYVESHKRFIKALRHVIIPEEFFFQTIIMNSAYSTDVVKKNLRYTDWTTRHGSRPAILDESDYDSIISSDNVFARKIDSLISKSLIEMLTEEFQT